MLSAAAGFQLDRRLAAHANMLNHLDQASTGLLRIGRGNSRTGTGQPTGLAMDDRVNARFVDGDPEALRHIYREHGGALYGIAYRVLGDPGLAEEALQQALLQAWRGAGRFDPDRNIAPWLVTITRRAAIDVYRRERRHRADELGDHDSMVPGTDMESVWTVYRVRQAVAKLPTREREVLALTHFEGLTHDAAAERLGLPIGTVKSRSYRAYRKLASLLEDMREAAK